MLKRWMGFPAAFVVSWSLLGSACGGYAPDFGVGPQLTNDDAGIGGSIEAGNGEAEGDGGGGGPDGGAP